MKPRRHRWGCLRLAFSLALGCFLLAALPARGFDFVQRSLSKSGQFIVYSPDVRLRLAVTGYAETTKQEVLTTLGLGDHWRYPVVVDLRRPASTDPSGLQSQVRLIQTEGGWKVQMDVVLREGEFKKIRFPQLVVRAILLELAYRDHPPKIGARYAEPPTWVVEGLAQNVQTRAAEAQPNSALFRQLIETGQLPRIRDFLKDHVEAMDPTSLSVYGACASSLVDMVSATPGGPARLVRMLQGVGQSDDGDPVALLLQYFPALGGSETELEKWWTLGLAHYSALDHHLSWSLPDTDARLATLLQIKVVTDEKKKTSAEFDLADFKAYRKLPGAKAALRAQSAAFAQLLGQAHPLLRPVISEYQRIVNDLSEGKTRRIGEAFKEVATYRGLMAERMDQIDDYLNWYEATQMPEQSGAFEDFMQGAKAMEKWTPPKRNDAISNYIDQLQREFE